MSKTKQDIISEISKDRVIERIIQKYNNSMYSDDLAQDLYIDLLGKDEELICRLYDTSQLEFYIRKMIRLNLNSNTSRFYRNYIKYQKITSSIEDEKKI